MAAARGMSAPRPLPRPQGWPAVRRGVRHRRRQPRARTLPLFRGGSMTMFAYICLGSNNLERSGRFYDATLGVLGYQRCDTAGESETSWNGWIGWGLYEKEGAIQDALW